MFRSIYLHFPFCETKCHYCDFYSIAHSRTSASDRSRFERALETECQLNLAHFKSVLTDPIETVFMGGGTPSMTPADSMHNSLRPLLEKLRWDSHLEWTMEANPSSISLSEMTQYRKMGVNRVSMGVQAMRDDLLLALGRVHSTQKATQALDQVFSAGFTNVSVDLLCGVPGQTLQDIRSAIDQLTAFPIRHMSCYLLTLPSHHKMFNSLPDEETQLSHLEFVDQCLSEKGFNHYEISNYCLPGFESRHNLNYWKRKSYLGLGPSAHAFDSKNKKRWKNISSLHSYCEKLESGERPLEWTEHLTPEQECLENWMLQLRLSEGFPEDWIKDREQEKSLESFMGEKYIERHPKNQGRYRLTARGFPLSDQIIQALYRGSIHNVLTGSSK